MLDLITNVVLAGCALGLVAIIVDQVVESLRYVIHDWRNNR